MTTVTDHALLVQMLGGALGEPEQETPPSTTTEDVRATPPPKTVGVAAYAPAPAAAPGPHPEAPSLPPQPATQTAAILLAELIHRDPLVASLLGTRTPERFEVDVVPGVNDGPYEAHIMTMVREVLLPIMRLCGILEVRTEPITVSPQGQLVPVLTEGMTSEEADLALIAWHIQTMFHTPFGIHPAHIDFAVNR